MPVIGYLYSRSPANRGQLLAFRQGLKEPATSRAKRSDRIPLGGGPIRSAAELAADLAASSGRVIAPSGTAAALAAQGGDHDHSDRIHDRRSDPWELGLVASLTGRAAMSPVCLP